MYSIAVMGALIVSGSVRDLCLPEVYGQAAAAAWHANTSCDALHFGGKLS